MSNIKDYARGRNDGLAMALRIVETEGIEGLRKEIKFRGAEDAARRKNGTGK